MAASMNAAVLQLSRLSIAGPSCRSFVTQSGPLAFRASAPLASEPMKRKKKQDVNIVIQREVKKRRRLEKAIRRLQAKGRKLKPVEEIEGDRAVIKTADIRQREPTTLTFDETERRLKLEKQWARYKYAQFTAELGQVRRAILSQQKALGELRLESEELYQAAIQTDEKLIPFEWTGPVQTPPIKMYEALDGEYIDTTKVFNK